MRATILFLANVKTRLWLLPTFFSSLCCFAFFQTTDRQTSVRITRMGSPSVSQSVGRPGHRGVIRACMCADRPSSFLLTRRLIETCLVARLASGMIKTCSLLCLHYYVRTLQDRAAAGLDWTGLHWTGLDTPHLFSYLPGVG